jgi:hypothetical protein
VDVTREVQCEDGEALYVTCSFAYDPPAEPVADAQEWGAPGADAVRWAAVVEATAAFGVLAGGDPPRASVVDAA